MRNSTWLLCLLLLSCDSVGHEAAGCDEVSAHLEAICGTFLALGAESLRYDCETFGMPTSDKLCVLRAKTCDEDVLDGCNLHDRIWVCSEGDLDCEA